jgi:hypothetical protein
MTEVITDTVKLECVKRELGMRERVYPRRIELNHMSPEKAAHEIAVMKEIVADYEALAAKERLL